MHPVLSVYSQHIDTRTAIKYLNLSWKSIVAVGKQRTQKISYFDSKVPVFKVLLCIPISRRMFQLLRTLRLHFKKKGD